MSVQFGKQTADQTHLMAIAKHLYLDRLVADQPILLLQKKFESMKWDKMHGDKSEMIGDKCDTIENDAEI